MPRRWFEERSRARDVRPRELLQKFCTKIHNTSKQIHGTCKLVMRPWGIVPRGGNARGRDEVRRISTPRRFAVSQALGIGAAVVLVNIAVAGAALAHGGSGACVTLKLRAAGDYYSCLLQSGAKRERAARCDRRFAWQFAQADRRDPGCAPLTDLERSQRGIRDQAQAVLVGDISQPPCQGITANNAGQVTCQLHVPGENIATTVAGLSDILAQVTVEPDCPTCSKVTANTPLWISGLGRDRRRRPRLDAGSARLRADGHKHRQNHRPGHRRPLLLPRWWRVHRRQQGWIGRCRHAGDQVDLQASPSTAPTDALLIAGGGGGGAGRVTSGCGSKTPGTGGDGGVAISVAGTDGQRFGQGVKGGHGGEGGGQGIGVGGGSDGVGGMGGNGGDGAGGSPPGRTGWLNTGATSLTFTSGEGGGGGGSDKSCVSGGGGGGGGFGGGGSGGDGDTDRAAGGGGGGGSYASASACTDAAAPTERPSAPSSDGNVYLVFNTAGTCS